MGLRRARSRFGLPVLPADCQRPLFPEVPDLTLPTYMLVVSFALVPAIAPTNFSLRLD